MSQPVVQVDAFTAEPFRGNPAAVCILDAPRDAAWMQAVALEMALSETAFIHPENGGYRLRWFTPAVEVALCGHATLATAHVLFEQGLLPPDATARFETQSGTLTADRHGEWIRLDFPAKPVRESELQPGLAEALGAEVIWCGLNGMDYLAELSSAEAVRSLQPDHRSLRGLGLRGVMVTARSDRPDFDFVSRFFAPGSGIDEDPVTGSAHCALAPYWAGKLGKRDLVGYQASPRGGVVRCVMDGERVYLYGQAVTTMRGELAV